MKSIHWVLDPKDRLEEILSGLIIVLTFIGSMSVATAGNNGLRALLIGALGCNLAWGIIDAVLYLMDCLAERRKGLQTLRAVRQTSDPAAAQRLIADALPSVVASILEPPEFETMRQRLKRLPEPPDHARLNANDWRGALSVFFLFFLSSFPVVIPFMFMKSVLPAVRVSNAIAIVFLFAAGFIYGRVTGGHPWGIGILMVLIGSLLVGLTIALGG